MADERRKRAHENLPGEATLSMLLPKGWSLLVIIGMGVAYASFTYANIEATADTVVMVQQTQAQHDERIQLLEKQEAVQNERLDQIREEQREQSEDAKADRREILDAIKSQRQ